MALKTERKNGNFSCFEKLDVLSEGLGDMLWSFEILHDGLEGDVLSEGLGDCYGASKSFMMV
jgi:hypothetical protein